MVELGQSLTRRQSLRLLAGGSLALAAGLGATDVASAGRAWCRVDPVISIDGQLADIYLTSTLSMNLKATGPTKIVITIPSTSTGRVHLVDLGFGLKGYQISFVKSAALTRTKTHTQVQIAAYAPASDSSLPVEVHFLSLSSGLASGLLTSAAGYGTANQWITVKTS